jgi:hypothetical protein
LELNSDLDLTFCRSLVFANVFSIVEIVQSVLKINSFSCNTFFSCPHLENLDFEDISSRCPVLSEVISCLDGEFNILSWTNLLRHAAWSVSERFDGTGVQEVVEIDPGS